MLYRIIRLADSGALRFQNLSLITSSGVSKGTCAPRGGELVPIYPARLRLGDNSTITFQCTSFLKFGSH